MNSNISDAVYAEEGGTKSVSTWATSPPKKLNEFRSQTMPKGADICSGNMTLIEVSGYTEFQSACVYGEVGGKRFARIVSENNGVYYAFAFSSDRIFRAIEGFCSGWVNCIYSQDRDVVYGVSPAVGYTSQLLRIDSFSQLLQQEGIPGQSHFKPVPMNGTYVNDGLGGNLGVRAVSMSQNGRWVALEIFGNAIARLDVHTGEVVKLFPLKSGLNLAGVRGIGVAISDTGEWLVMTGQSNQTTLYQVSNGCGYFPIGDDISSYCRAIDVDEPALFPGYTAAYAPKLSGDGLQLALRVDTTLGPKRATLLPQDAIEYSNTQYIAFGDSFSSGQGETSDDFYEPDTNTGTNQCHVSTRSYPYLMARVWEYNAKNYACSGSRINDVKATVARQALLKQSPIIMSSLGVGGNDINMMGKLQTCISPGTCEWAKEGNRASTANEIKQQLPRLIEVIQQIQSLTGSSVFVVGYPLIINPDEAASCSLLEGISFTYEERQYMNAALTLLNGMMQTAAQYTDAIYIDLSDSFTGGRLCDANHSYMNTIRTGDDIAPLSGLPDVRVIGAESFHPTPEGHAAMARTFAEKAGIFWETGECRDCANNSQLPEYWTLGATLGQLSTYSFLESFIKTTAVTRGSMVEFRFNAGTFAENSQVTVEIHSEPKTLGVYTSNADGSLEGSVAIPTDVEVGDHTIHAKSESVSGDLVDYYQPVYVEPTKDTQNDVTTSSVTIEDTLASQLAQLSVAPPLQGTFSDSSQSVLGEHSQAKKWGSSLVQLPYKQTTVPQLPKQPLRVNGVVYAVFSAVILIVVCWFLFRTE